MTGRAITRVWFGVRRVAFPVREGLRDLFSGTLLPGVAASAVAAKIKPNWLRV